MSADTKAATPRPWRREGGPREEGWSISGGGRRVALVPSKLHRIPDAEDDANAALIVEAVNAYDDLKAEIAKWKARAEHRRDHAAPDLKAQNAELVEALTVVDDYERNPGLNYTQADVRLVVRAALAKAGGR